MRILLFILKIIGILLLVILLLTVLLVFYPVSYRLEGRIDERLSLRGRLSWLLRSVRLDFELEENELKLRTGILFFRWNLGGKQTEDESSEFREEKKYKEFTGAREGTGQDEAVEVSEEAERREPPHRIVTESEADRSTEQNPEAEYFGKIRKEKPDEQSEHPRESTKKKKFQGINVSGWKERIRAMQKEFTNEGNKMAVSHLWQEVLYLLSHLKPDYIHTEIDFSAGDPAVTGQVTGMLSLLPIMYWYDTHVYPDFLSEEFYIRGQFQLKGHMAFYHMIRCLIRIWNDRNIKRLWNKFRK